MFLLLQDAFAITSGLLADDPYTSEALPVHLAAAVELRRTSDLFLLGHRRAFGLDLSSQPLNWR